MFDEHHLHLKGRNCGDKKWRETLQNARPRRKTENLVFPKFRGLVHARRSTAAFYVSARRPIVSGLCPVCEFSHIKRINAGSVAVTASSSLLLFVVVVVVVALYYYANFQPGIFRVHKRSIVDYSYRFRASKDNICYAWGGRRRRLELITPILRSVVVSPLSRRPCT